MTFTEKEIQAFLKIFHHISKDGIIYGEDGTMTSVYTDGGFCQMKAIKNWIIAHDKRILKMLPKKFEERRIGTFEAGWNDCIDVITESLTK